MPALRAALTICSFWWGATRAREVAVSAARRACTRCGVQFLDDSVALAKTCLTPEKIMTPQAFRNALTARDAEANLAAEYDFIRGYLESA